MSSLRPLRVRPGVRFACAGDGLCCTDVHALGPLTRREARALDAEFPGASERHPRLPLVVLRMEGAQCSFLGASGCAIHAAAGSTLQPATCKRFPFSLVATPEGGRIVTAHRCPCRTLGARPLLDVAAAATALRSGGRLTADRSVPERLRWSRRRYVSFRSYVAEETKLLTRLAAGEDVAAVLGVEALPELESMAWQDVAHELRSLVDGTTGGEALAFFGDALLSLTEERRLRLRARSWASAFDRAEARAPDARPAAEVLADWVADLLYAMSWAPASFEQGRAFVGAWHLVARHLTAALVRDGVRPDRAAAEAVMAAELAAEVPVGQMLPMHLPDGP